MGSLKTHLKVVGSIVTAIALVVLGVKWTPVFIGLVAMAFATWLYVSLYLIFSD